MEFHAGLYTALVNLRSDAEVSFDGAGSSDRVDDTIGNDWEENEDKVNIVVVSCRFISVKALTGDI